MSVQILTLFQGRQVKNIPEVWPSSGKKTVVFGEPEANMGHLNSSP